MKFAEIHCHTIYSNVGSKIESLITPEKLLKEAKERGLSAIAITDHNTMRGSEISQEIADKYGLIVIPAEEFDTDGNGQILGYVVKKGIESFRKTSEIIKDIHRCGGIAIMAHPFDIVRGMENPEEVAKEADGIEILNYGAFNNNISRELAEHLNGKIKTGGSDAHTWRVLGSVRLGFPENCQTVDDYLAALRAGDFVLKTTMNYYHALLLGALNLLMVRIISFVRKI